MAGSISKPRYIFQTYAFHIVDESPWPFLTANAVLAIMIGAVLYFNGIVNGTNFLILGVLSTIFAIVLWLHNVTTEGTYLGNHTLIVQKGLIIGVSLFIVTEVFFFVSIFWAYFHAALSPTVELGSQWPPVGITPLNPIIVPLLNTILLLSSGAVVTYRHHGLIEDSRVKAIFGVFITILIAGFFTYLQIIEYSDCDFSISDRVYGSCFYFSTGFHGAHVRLGTIAIIVAFFRVIYYQLTREHHLGFESAILYWHFVDFVWLILYFSVYWWGSDAVTIF